MRTRMGKNMKSKWTNSEAPFFSKVSTALPEFGGAGTTRFTGATVSVGLSQPIYRRELLMGLGQVRA